MRSYEIDTVCVTMEGRECCKAVGDGGHLMGEIALGAGGWATLVNTGQWGN